jgi:hypothetical protein
MPPRAGDRELEGKGAQLLVVELAARAVLADLGVLLRALALALDQLDVVASRVPNGAAAKSANWHLTT